MLDIYNQFKDFKSFEVVYLDENGNPQKIFCVVKCIENDSIVLTAENQKNVGKSANISDELKLHIYTENGIYSATSKIINVDKGLLTTEYVIAYPANSKHSQRREYFRADLDIKFKMTVVVNEDNKESFTIESKTRNICGKGMSFVHDKDLGDYQSAHLKLSFFEKTVETSAILVYSKQIVVGSKPKYILAFTFNDISTSNIDFIVKKCFLHQLELRKKNRS